MKGLDEEGAKRKQRAQEELCRQLSAVRPGESLWRMTWVPLGIGAVIGVWLAGFAGCCIGAILGWGWGVLQGLRLSSGIGEATEFRDLPATIHEESESGKPPRIRV